MQIVRKVATPVILIALLLLLYFGARWGWENLTAPVPERAPTPCVTMKDDVITTRDVFVRVLNGGYTTGLAYRTAQRLTETGMTVVYKGNTEDEERIKKTIIRGSQQDAAAISIVQSYLVDATVQYDDRVTGVIDVLVGSEFGGFTEQEKFAEATPKNGIKCIPAKYVEEVRERDANPTGQAPTPTPAPKTEG